MRPVTSRFEFRTKRAVPRLGCGGAAAAAARMAPLSSRPPRRAQAHARRLGRQQRQHGDRGRAGQPRARPRLARPPLPPPRAPLTDWPTYNAYSLPFSFLRRGISWDTKAGPQAPNYYGSLTQASTCRLGSLADGTDVFVPFSQLLPMARPNDLVIGGWDVSGADMAAAMRRSQVLDVDLQRRLAPLMAPLVPLPSIFDPSFVAPNQAARADNVLGGSKAEQVAAVRAHIRAFKRDHNLGQVVVLWTATTERYCELVPGVHDSEAGLRAGVAAGHPEVSPSTLFGLACVDEGVPFVNGSPQNTFVPGLVQAASRLGVVIAGDDFKSGQTKLKSVLVDFLVSAGIKPLAVASYNHLGNNDGANLQAGAQFRSKEISKSSVLADAVASNPLLYPLGGAGDAPDHVVVIKYVPSVGDSKRALDEYTSEIFMGGRNTLVLHNTCEDSLLAAPLILDLCVLAELLTRLSLRRVGGGCGDGDGAGGGDGDAEGEEAEFHPLHPVSVLLSYLAKAPLAVPGGGAVVNALGRQRALLENVLRAAVGLPPDSAMHTAMEGPARGGGGCAAAAGAGKRGERACEGNTTK